MTEPGPGPGPGPEEIDARLTAGQISMAEYWRLRASAEHRDPDRTGDPTSDLHRVRPTGSGSGPVPSPPGAGDPPTGPAPAAGRGPGSGSGSGSSPWVPPPPPAHGGPQPWVSLPLTRPSAEAAGQRPGSRRRRRRGKG